MKRSRILFIGLVWLCFLIRGLFYCSFIPLWEGYDEWGHFGFVERIVGTGRPLINRDEPLSLEVQTSRQLAPAPWGTAKPFLTEDDFWQLPASDRADRIRQINELSLNWSHQPDPAGSPIYEALQPPLYYWISALPYWLLENRPLVERVFALRYFAILICSLAIPIIFLIARRVSGSDRTACFIILLLAVLPELMIDVSRVGNECLGIVVFSWLTLLALPNEKASTTRRTAIWTGVALGFGLLTKAYFLTIMPALAILYLRRMRLFSAFGIALAIAGWWYLRNRLTTGSWSGLLETTKLVHYSAGQFWSGAMHVDWRNAIDSILVSHIWFGDWSSLSVRSWIYHLLFVIAVVGGCGLVLAFIKGDTKGRRLLLPLILIYAFFWVGQLYNVQLLFLTKGASTSMGWYMYCVVAAEITLLVVGLQSLLPIRFRSAAIAILILLVAALDFYTVHFVSIPYYTGLISHRVGDGALAAFHLSQLHTGSFGEILERLCVIKPFWITPHSLGLLWATDVLATLLLSASGFWLATRTRFEIPELPHVKAHSIAHPFA